MNKNLIKQIKTRTILIFKTIFSNYIILNRLNTDCKLCKDKIDDINQMNCYAHKIIALQPDFLLQKSMLEEAILKVGYKCIFYLKFHCELNYIK